MPIHDLVNASLSAFAETMRTGGIASGLSFLNARVPHRCTGVYQLEGMNIRSVYLYDRKGELLPESLGSVPLNESFCEHALRDGMFLTSDSSLDERVNGSLMKGVVIAYCGIPLLDRSGTLFGSLCHFDYVPRTLPSDEFAFLQEAANKMAPFL